MIDMIDVSVVIVNWNTKRLLLECIESIVSGTSRSRVEVIVVDNASYDGSADAVEEAFPGCKVIRNQSNMGFAAANNRGIAASVGRHVCLVNSDVKLLDGCLDTMCVYMDSRPEIGVLGPQILNKDLTIQLTWTELPSVRNLLAQALFCPRLFPSIRWLHSRFKTALDHQAIQSVPVLSGCFLMVRRKALEQVGLLDERFYIYKEDVDWCKRFGDEGWPVVFYPEAQAIHYGGASSSRAPARFLIEMEKANIQYWKKYYSPLTGTVVRLISAIHYGIRLAGWATLYLAVRKRRATASEMVSKYAQTLLWLGGAGRQHSV